jgi:hypothetical protein
MAGQLAPCLLLFLGWGAHGRRGAVTAGPNDDKTHVSMSSIDDTVFLY